jgi:lysophospholipase L1-like esterase
MATPRDDGRAPGAVNALRRGAFALVPLLALLLGGEAMTRVAGGPECAAIAPAATGWDTMMADARYLWKLEPDRVLVSPQGSARANAVGLRTALLPSDTKAPEERRLVLTGDSSVYGWGLPDGQTYADQLQAELNLGIVGARVSVVNLGVPGYSTEQSLRQLEDVGWDYAPDLLLVHNIFSDCNIDAFQDRAALALATPESSAAYRALHRSRLFCAAYMPIARARATFMQEPNRVLMPGRPAGANAAMALEKIDQVIDLSRVPLGDYLANLDAMRAGASAHGAAMVLAPLAQEWDAGVWNLPGTPPPTEGQVLPWHPYREAQATWGAVNGVGRIDIPGAFAAAPGDPADLFIDNIHPSTWGARVMTCVVATYLRAHPDVLGLSAAQLPARTCTPVPPPASAHRARPGQRPQGVPQGPPPNGAPPNGAPPTGANSPPQGPAVPEGPPIPP